MNLTCFQCHCEMYFAQFRSVLFLVFTPFRHEELMPCQTRLYHFLVAAGEKQKEQVQ